LFEAGYVGILAEFGDVKLIVRYHFGKPEVEQLTSEILVQLVRDFFTVN